MFFLSAYFREQYWEAYGGRSAWKLVDLNDVLRGVIEAMPEQAATEIVELAQSAPDDEALRYLGAGPVEEVVRTGDGNAIDVVKAAALGDQKFNTAVFNMYLPGGKRVQSLDDLDEVRE